MAILTLNNIFDLLKLIADNHEFVKFYGHGEIGRFNGENYKDAKYPVVWAMLGSSTQLDNQTQQTISLYCFDLLEKNYENENEVFSDTKQILQDFVRILKQHSVNYQLEPGNIYEPFTEEFNSLCAGWVTDLTINVDFDDSECGVPVLEFDLPGGGGNNNGGNGGFNCNDLLECDLFNALQSLVDEHVADTDNPHETTAEQVGALTDQETLDLILQYLTGLANYYFYNTASDIGSGYKKMLSSASIGGEQYIANSSLADGDILAIFATEPNVPNVTILPEGVIRFRVYGQRTGGTKTTKLYAQVYKRTALGVETLICESGESTALDATISQVEFPCVTTQDTLLNATDRIVVYLRVRVSGGGSSPDVTISVEGTHASRVELPIAASGGVPSLEQVRQVSNIISGIIQSTLGNSYLQLADNIAGLFLDVATVQLYPSGDPLGTTITHDTVIRLDAPYTDLLNKNIKNLADAVASGDAVNFGQLTQAVAGVLNLRTSWNASGNVFPSTGGSGISGAIKKGDLWIVSVAGTLGGQAVTVGDYFFAITDTPGQTAANWAINEVNITYVPENVSNKDTDGTLAANSDTKYASQKAIKTYVDNAVAATAITGKVLTGLSAVSGTYTSSDSILTALNKLKYLLDTTVPTLLIKSNNLSDLTNATTARTNLGLGNSATKNVGTTTGTVASGDDSRFSGISISFGHISVNPVSSTTYYFGINTNILPVTSSQGRSRGAALITGIVNAVRLNLNYSVAGGTSTGTYKLKNVTTGIEITLGVIDFTVVATGAGFTYTGLSLSVSTGDELEVTFTTTTSVPTSLSSAASIFIKST